MDINILIEQLFKIKDIKNGLIIGDNDITDFIIKKIREKNGLVFSCKNKLFEVTSITNPIASEVRGKIKLNNNFVDLVYISSEIKDIEFILEDILEFDGIIVFDKVTPNSIIENAFTMVYNRNNHICYQRTKNNDKYILEDMNKRINYIEEKKQTKKRNKKITIGIGIPTYNHENYIEECLNSIFKQSKEYIYKVIIIDDYSSDKTPEIIDKYLETKKIPKNFKIEFIKNKENKGVINSLKYILTKFKNTDYFSFCEGDDYWNNSQRVKKMVEYMSKNSDVSVAFNGIYILDDQKRTIEKNIEHLILKKEFFITPELIKDNYFIGNLGCSFYDSFSLNYLDSKVFKLPFYDFFINTYFSTFGTIGFVNEYLSTYRKNQKSSMWSSVPLNAKVKKLLSYIDQYNQYFNFLYNDEYDSSKNRIYKNITFLEREKLDLLIIDNIFPNKLSPFTYTEISNYLYNIKKSAVLCTYLNTNSLSNETLQEGFQKYKRENNEIAHKLIPYNDITRKKIKAKVMYFIFKSTATIYYDYIKESKTDFVVELYPGGGLFFDDPICDNDLRNLAKLNHFKKFIVTQEPVREYLLKKKICKENQIEMIFGVVLTDIKKSYIDKEAYFKKKKETLDIVFMAYRYEEKGRDKGYDLFIETAKKLCKKYDNIKFHVVGNYDEGVIDINDIKDNIKFYGKLTEDKFNNFFADKDIILSPNRVNVLAKGAFDGFPTASVTEAGIRGLVMVCSDELDMCRNYYEKDKELVIVKTEVDDIVKHIEDLYKHPKKIEEISKAGQQKILKLYSYDYQIKPRLNVINEIINERKKKND